MQRRSESNNVRSEDVKPNMANSGRKTYRPPRLVIYGDVHILTAGKAGGAGDKGTPPNTMS